MPNTPNASFIPKQGPARQVRRTATRQIHVFTIISYVAFVATLIASLGLFLYNNHLEKQLTKEVEKLSLAIEGFSDSDMQQVREFNFRLHQAQSRLDQSVSFVSIFDALETATAQSVSISELTVKRDEDTNFTVSAKVLTNSFDSSLFQRGLYERNSVIKDVAVSNITLGKTEEGKTDGDVSFVAKISVPLKDVPYKPNEVNVPASPVTPEAATTTASTSTKPKTS